MNGNTRRGFLQGMAGIGATVVVAGCAGTRTARGTGKFDDGLAVLVSDLHVGGAADCPLHHSGPALKRIVDEILAMDPLPRHVVCLGDIGYLYGDPADYRISRPILQPLLDAGIDFRTAMGNHDRRSGFLAMWPEYRASTLVPGRIVSVVAMRDCDIVLLDTLKGADDRGLHDMGPGDGTVDPEQLAWFDDYVAKAKRPFFVATHHTTDLRLPGTDRLELHALKSPYACGWLQGHDHEWRSSFRFQSWSTHLTLPTLTLPSTGLWGDIGYVLFRTTPTEATAELVQHDFYFPSPVPPAERPCDWDIRVRDNRGLKMRFALGAVRRATAAPRL